MTTFKFLFKPFDFFVLIIGIITVISLSIKGIVSKSEVYGFCAFLTLLVTIIHGKLASINKNP